jgi:hypothetical protein
MGSWRRVGPGQGGANTAARVGDEKGAGIPHPSICTGCGCGNIDKKMVATCSRAARPSLPKRPPYPSPEAGREQKELGPPSPAACMGRGDNGRVFGDMVGAS